MQQKPILRDKYGRLLKGSRGLTPSNRISKICLTCNKEMYVPAYEANKRKTCSKICRNQYWTNISNRPSREKICIELAKQNKTIREISEITGFKSGSVSSYLNKAKFRKRTEPGQSYTSVLNRLKKHKDYQECSICSFKRVIEVAHIIPASKGGELSYNNTIPLCANCHHLFDNNELTNEENNKLQNKIKEKSNAY